MRNYILPVFVLATLLCLVASNTFSKIDKTETKAARSGQSYLATPLN